jgi:hypothetical protein
VSDAELNWRCKKGRKKKKKKKSKRRDKASQGTGEAQVQLGRYLGRYLLDSSNSAALPHLKHPVSHLPRYLSRR